MKNSIELLNEIIKTIGDDWKKYLDTYLKLDTDETETEETAEYSDLFSDFINLYKEDVIANKTSILKQIEKTIDNDLLFNNLKSHADKLLKAYNAINPLRVLEVKDYKKATQLIDFIFKQVILRFNPDAEEKSPEFGMEKEEFLEVGSVLNSLCTFIVSQNLHKEAMVDVIQYNTKLEKNTSECIADIIDKNFESLKTKIILNKLFSDI